MSEEEKTRMLNGVEHAIKNFNGNLEDCIAIGKLLNEYKLKSKVLEKQDKIIDLMAEYIGNDDITEIFCDEKEYCDEDCKKCVKQYFERKVEDDSSSSNKN